MNLDVHKDCSDFIYYTIEVSQSFGKIWNYARPTYSSGNERFDTHEDAYKIALPLDKNGKSRFLRHNKELDVSVFGMPYREQYRVVKHRYTRTPSSSTHHKEWTLV